MKSFLLLISILLVQQVGLSQSPAKILKRAEAALGGTKALQAMRSVERTGEIVRRSDASHGRITIASAKPDSYTIVYDLDGFQVASGFNGKSAWTRDSRVGLRTITGPASLNFRTESVYRNAFWLDYKKDKTRLLAGVAANIDGKPVKTVILKTAKGVDIKISFDEGSLLPVREEFSSGGETVSYDYADFRRVGALTQPSRMVYRSGDETFDIKLDAVLYDRSIAAGRFDFPVISTEPLPDIPALLRDVQANEDRVEQLLENYAFTQKRTGREAAKDGTLIEKDSETFQVSFYKGLRISRLIEKNGKPLTESEQKDADRDAAKRVDEIDKIIAKREAGKPDESQQMSIAEILRASNLVNPRRERFRDRDVIVFDF